MSCMQEDISQILIPQQQIAQRIAAMAAQITRDFQSSLTRSETPKNSMEEEDPELVIVPVLTGSIIFLADLIRRLPLRLRIRLISVSSYPGTAIKAKEAVIQQSLTNLPASLEKAHVLVLDDILDSGQTLERVCKLIRQRQPASLRTCVLLRKPTPGAEKLAVDYVGFNIPDKFVVGYGLDFNGYYRNLPDIVTLHERITHHPEN